MVKDSLFIVISCQSSQEVWLTLEKKFYSLSRSHIHELKSALHTIAKNLGESIDDYLLQIKELVEKLASVFVKINDEDLLYMLNGFSSEYNSFRTSIRTSLNSDLSISHSSKINICDCVSCLKGEMSKLSFPISTSETFEPFALIHSDVRRPSPMFLYLVFTIK